MKKQSKFFSNPVIKIITKTISWVILAILVLFAGLLIYNIVSSKIYEIRGQKYEPEISLYTIISPSMEPNINVYDVVITKKVRDFSTIKEGDVITFISSSSLGEGLTVTHRVKSIIKTENDIKFRTQGDNNPIPDSALASSSNVLGKVIFKIPWIGHIQFLLQSKGGWLFALLIPAMIVVVYDIVKVIRLSDIKQKVNEASKDKPEDSALIEKKEKLKNDLKKKYEINDDDYGEEPIQTKPEPLIRKESIFERESKNNKNIVKEEEKIVIPVQQETIPEESEPKKVISVDESKHDGKEIIKKYDFNTDNIIKENENEKMKESDLDIKKVISNISLLEDDSLDLPKTKE